MELDIRVQAEDFSVDDVLAGIRRRQREAGAVVSFVGLVRERGQAMTGAIDACALEPSTPALFLEHYPGVTERSIEAIAREAGQRWPLLAVCVVHRVGWLAPSEQIVLVAAVSSHRHAAFSAAAFLMDYLKTEAVLWKKERNSDGAERWIEATAADRDATKAWQLQPLG